MNLRKPVWTEGLFVTQHHFQQADVYHETLVNERLRSVHPYGWGLVELELDVRALQAGEVSITRLVGFLPNGTPVRLDTRAGDAPLSRPFDTAFPAHIPSLEVYVGVPEEGQARPNVELEEQANTASRYLAERKSVLDYNTARGEHEVSWARPNLRVVFGSEPRDAYDALRVVELVRAGSGQVIPRDTYVPPVLRIETSPFLIGGFRRVLNAMTVRQRELASSRRQRTEAAVEFEASDAAKFWMLGALNETIPVFSHFVDAGSASPEQAYLALAQFMGKMSTFAVKGDLVAIPKFDYLGLGDVFEPMFARTLSLLDTVVVERYVQIPLTRRVDGVMLGQVDNPNLWRHDFYLAASGQASEVEIRERLPRLTKIGSVNSITVLLKSAVNGVRLELDYKPPGALPIRPGTVFFKVEKTPEYWADVQRTGTIAVYHPIPQHLVDVALFAVEPASG